MKIHPFSFFIISLLAFFSSPHISFALDPSVTISEIQISGVSADDEFVRLKNETTDTIDLSGFKLTKKTLSGDTCKESSLVSTKHFQGILSPQGFFLIAHPKYKTSRHADLEYSGASYYITDNTTILLYDKSNILLDKKSLGAPCDIPSLPPDPSEEPKTTPPEPKNFSLRINEIFPNPKTKGDEGEFVELHNFGTEEINLSKWTLRDGAKTGKYIFPNTTIIKKGEYLVITDQIFKLSLNNTNESLSLFDAGGFPVHSLSYEKTKEGVSLNYTLNGWRGGRPTPGKENILNTLPETKEKVPKKGFSKVPLLFNAKGKDIDNDTLKYTWDFGDGHKSYKKKTSHLYENNGTYTVTLLTTDGHDDLKETFPLVISSYKPPRVRITAIAPNPQGKDADHEYLIIENKEKKEVDLKDFSIATGTKKLTNHPIRESFIIGAKKSAPLTRKDALFTLPNKKGLVELRGPNGETIQKIKYTSATTIKENVLYQKTKKGKWLWQYHSSEKSNPSIKETLDPVTETLPEIPEEEVVSPQESASPEDETLSLLKEIEETVRRAETKRNTFSIAKSSEKHFTPNKNLKKPQDFLSFGTRFRLPETITFVLSQK
ncbi:MAG: lamin tail domain-containing protein [Candidatus Moranbacteria bacterium]|nr:lamin tail domain-containing protein [Candidatus Moranbacteria bacterium]